MNIATTAKPKPSRILLFATPKWGKTSWACYAPDPIFLMTRGEDGLQTLLSYGRVPETSHFEQEALDWYEVENAIDFLLHENHGKRTFTMDTLNGGMQLLFDAICREEFGNNWVDFAAFGRGVDIAIPRVQAFIMKLEKLRRQKGMSIILLAHNRVKTQKNPGAADYDQFQAEMPDKIANLFHKWADCLLSGSIETREKKQTQSMRQQDKAKIETEGIRTIITGDSAGHLAGNRYGLPKVIRGGLDAKSTWDAFAKAMAAARPKPPQPQPQPLSTSPPTVATEPPASQSANPSAGDFDRGSLMSRLNEASGYLHIQPQESVAKFGGSAGLKVPFSTPLESLTLEQLLGLVLATEYELERLANAGEGG